VDGWKPLVPLTAGLAGLLLATSAITARGTDLRASRSLDVGQLIQRQQQTLTGLTREERALRARIATATARVAVGDRRVRAARSAGDRLLAAAGLTAVSGPAVTVALDDAAHADQQRDLAAGARPDDLVIHQQDVQGVVNALWAGGTDAMTIMGQRVVSTTAVRCVGNTLLLHGQVFSPPFVITAIGDRARLRRALDADQAVQVFQQYVAAYGLRFHLSMHDNVTLPAYAGSLGFTRARAAS
jgi:uncharacterized protein YlxW (UPF0749 family)